MTDQENIRKYYAGELTDGWRWFGAHPTVRDGVEGWIFDENRQELLTYQRDERLFEDGEEISMVFFMEKGKKYYIDIAFWDPYEVGYIYYDIEYIGASYDHFRLCSHGYFTYDTDASGEAMYDVIAGGIDVVLGEDGYYYHDLGNGKKGSKIYLDFVNSTPAFPSGSLSTIGELKGLIDRGQFDFSKTEEDEIVLNYLKQANGDEAKALENMKKDFGDGFDEVYDTYKVKDVFAGIYHGEGEDYTEIMRQYEKQMIKSGSSEMYGCLAVDEELAKILQMLMDKWSFKGVETSWRKLCYYYETVG